MILIDFDSEAAPNSWAPINDVVMGGASESRFDYVGGSTAKFSGIVSVTNSGGFASVRSTPSLHDLQRYSGLLLRVRGDGKQYKMNLKMEAALDGVQYQAVFTTQTGTWTEILIPFSTFVPMFRGMHTYDSSPLDPASIRSFGLLISDKQEGPFRIDIDRISAVTFITASAFLQRIGFPSSGHMVAAMALMESPAMVIGVLLIRKAQYGKGTTMKWGTFLHDALLNGSVFLLMGSLVIGAVAGKSGWESARPFTKEIFKGMLAFFLLDMGILAAKRLNDLRSHGSFLVGFAIGIPILNATLGMAIAALIGLGEGDALLFTILCGSASYIAVPAALRLAVPEANPSLYVPMSLAITFPFNIILGIPVYASIIHSLWT